MDNERRRRALEVLRNLNAAKHSDSLKELIGEESEKHSAIVDNEVLDESREDLMREAARKRNLESSLNRDEDVEKEKVPKVNDISEEFKDLIKQLRKK